MAEEVSKTDAEILQLLEAHKARPIDLNSPKLRRAFLMNAIPVLVVIGYAMNHSLGSVGKLGAGILMKGEYFGWPSVNFLIHMTVSILCLGGMNVSIFIAGALYGNRWQLIFHPGAILCLAFIAGQMLETLSNLVALNS